MLPRGSHEDGPHAAAEEMTERNNEEQSGRLKKKKPCVEVLEVDINWPRWEPILAPNAVQRGFFLSFCRRERNRAGRPAQAPEREV